MLIGKSNVYALKKKQKEAFPYLLPHNVDFECGVESAIG